jgi:hypothetical protein
MLFYLAFTAYFVDTAQIYARLRLPLDRKTDVGESTDVEVLGVCRLYVHDE